ncbi:MAG TPA: rhodanese-like domain-containing protein [Nocardioides sp.]|nr:rhodanese-like domain-containing protein [Nocardioides sp.]
MHLAPVPSVRVADLPDPVPDDVTLLDVREAVEWEHGHAPDALHVPMGEIPSRLDELPEGRLVVVCHVGGRSARVTSYLAGLGLDVVNLDGGMADWAAAGRPLVSETGRPPVVV